jgi:hypothetical protein
MTTSVRNEKRSNVPTEREQRKGNVMDRNKLPADPVKLFGLAEATAKALAKQHGDLRPDEAGLRAAIVWASFARNSYLAVVKRAKRSSKVRPLVEPARKACARAERHLRLRLAALIAP